MTLLVLAGGLAGACSPLPQRVSEDPAAAQAYEARSLVLAPIDQWKIRGRLAITDGEEGGSGALIWIENGGGTRMSFRGTLGQGSWLLEADGHGARLQLADGREYMAGDVAELVQAHVGWKVPVDALSWWVRGLSANGSWQERRLDEAGRITHLQQAGWEVEFGTYREHEALWLPARLTARRGSYTVKLAVREWTIGGGEVPLD
jgi:outer membrane lipoprotein LolB